MMFLRAFLMFSAVAGSLLLANAAHADSGYSYRSHNSSYSYGAYSGGHSRYSGGGNYSSGRRYSAPARSYISGGRYYRHSYGGPGYNSWGRNAAFTKDTSHRGTYNRRWQRWENQELQRQQAMAQNGGPCGIYNRASSAGCRYTTMPYLPWVHGDR